MNPENGFLEFNNLDTNEMYKMIIGKDPIEEEIYDLIFLKKTSKFIKDNIFDLIAIPDYIMKIIDTPEFQRLHYIKQLGLIHLIYPGAVHTRFSHSLGVYHLAQNYIWKFIWNGLRIRKDETNCEPLLSDFLNPTLIKVFFIAALCHDIGHLPLSHVMSEIFDQEHQEAGAELIEKQEDEITKIQELIMLEVFGGESNSDYLSLVSLMIREELNEEHIETLGKFCVKYDIKLHIFVQFKNILHLILDRVDYLLRDSYNCGLKYGDFEYIRLLNNLSLNFTDNNQGKFFILEKGLDAYQCLLLARLNMYKVCYYHKTSRSIEKMIISAVLESRKINISKDTELERIKNELFEEYEDLTDELIWRDLVREKSIFKKLRFYKEEDEAKIFYENLGGFLVREIFKRNNFKRVVTLWRDEFDEFRSDSSESKSNDALKDYMNLHSIFNKDGEHYKLFQSFINDFKDLALVYIINEIQGLSEDPIKIGILPYIKSKFKDNFLIFDYPSLKESHKQFRDEIEREISNDFSGSRYRFKNHKRPYIICSNQFMHFSKNDLNFLYRRNNDRFLKKIEFENKKSSYYYYPLRIFIIKRIPILYQSNKVEYLVLEEKHARKLRGNWNILFNKEKYKKFKNFFPELRNTE